MAKLTTEQRAYLFDLYGPYICNGEEDDFKILRTLIADKSDTADIIRRCNAIIGLMQNMKDDLNRMRRCDMHMMLIDVKGEPGGFLFVDIEPTLAEYYRLLKCRTIEMPLYDVDGHKMTVICDEEGALKDDRIISAINPYGQPLFGNLLICGIAHTQDGLEERGLSEGARGALVQRMGIMADSDGMLHPAIDLRKRD